MGRHLRTGVRLSSSPPDKEVLLHTYCAAAPFFHFPLWGCLLIEKYAIIKNDHFGTLLEQG